MRIWHLLVPLGLCCATAAMADVPTATRSAADVNAGLARYNAWLAKLDLTEADALKVPDEMDAQWSRAIATRNANRISAMFRPQMARFKAVLATTNDKLRATDTPDFPELPLSTDIEPTTLVRSYLDLNSKFAAIVDSYGPIIVAIQRNDPAGARRAFAITEHGIALLLDVRARMAQAHIASAPADSSLVELGGLQVDYFHAAARIIGSSAIGTGRLDAALAVHLGVIAEDCDRVATAGKAKADRQIEAFQNASTQAAMEGDRDRVVLFDHLVALKRAELPAYPLATRMANLLRVHIATLRSKPLTPELAKAMMYSLLPYRDALIEIRNARGNAPLAGTH